MDISELYKHFVESTGISTDTRSLQEGNLYVALSGENFDGNTFVSKAFEKGAAHALISDPAQAVSEKTMLVKDTLKTLQKLAAYHRSQLGLPIISLTGSNGKTTTKELFNAVLSKKYKTVATQGNLNNHIGVPLTLLRMTKNTEVGIVEMGANHLKEIELLCSIAKPDFGYITNFGKAHLEGFGSEEGVIKGKSELYDHLREKNSMVFLNTDDAKQTKQAEGIEAFTFGKEKNNDVVVLDSTAQPFAEITTKKTKINSQLIGSYNITNISAAVAVGFYFKVPINDIKEAIASYVPGNNRSQLIKKGEATIILDAYNANPTSMEAALTNFQNLEARHKILFLGDMFELGTTAAEEHRHITKLALSTKAELIFLLGNHFKAVQIKKDKLYYFKNVEELIQNPPNVLKAFLKKEVHILIKGSRGMAMERLLPMLEQSTGN